MSTARAILFTAVAAASGCVTPSREPDIEAINTLQARVDSAIIAGETEIYLELVTPDAVLMPPNEPPVVGRAAIRPWSEAMSRRARILAYTPSDEEVVVMGDWAFRRGVFDWTVAITGRREPLHNQGKFVIIYRRDGNGVWRIARDIWNSSTAS